MIKPYINDSYSRSKLFTNGTYTGLWLITCLLAGYSYAKLQRDEVMRRRYYARYSNFMSAFDYCTPILEEKWDSFLNRLFSFDSAHTFWHLKNQKMAEIRALRSLNDEIVQKQVEESDDEISKFLLRMDKVEDMPDPSEVIDRINGKTK